MFARLGLSAENPYLSGTKVKAFGEEFEEGLVGGSFFGWAGNGDLEVLAEGANYAVATGAWYDLYGEAAAASGVGGFQIREVEGHGLKSITEKTSLSTRSRQAGGGNRTLNPSFTKAVLYR